MALWRTLTDGLCKLLNRRAAERDLDDELRHFVAMATKANVDRGMTQEAAARAARVSVGSMEAAKTEVRSAGWNGVIDAMRQDLTLAVRGLRRSRAFTLTAVVSLALGIGAVTTMFSLVNAVMWRPLPYQDGDRLVLIWTDDTRRGLHREPSPFVTISDWRAQARSFSSLAYFTTQRVAPKANDPGGGRGRSRLALVSANVFDVLGVAPARGRLLSEADERDKAPVAVITHAYWQRWFNGADDVVGRSLTIDDGGKGGIGTLTVVGVLPASFYFPDRQTEVYTPSTRYWRFDRESNERFAGWARRWTVIARLAPGASSSTARADLDALGRQLSSTYTTTEPDFPGFATSVVPMLDSIAGPGLQSSLWILLAALGAVLLVVCGNLANLLLARGAARQREFAVQRALGAGRGRLVRQLLSESLLLVTVGGGVGTALALWMTPWIASEMSSYLPRMDEIAIDVRVLVFAVGTSIAAGLIFAMVPAIRVSGAKAADALRDGGRGTASPQLRRSQNLLVFAECALALVLLTGAGLLLKSLYQLYAVQPGFDPSGVLAVRLEFPPEPPPTAEEQTQTSNIAQSRARARAQSLDDLLDRIRRMPGAASVAVTDDLYVAGQGNDTITLPGRSTDSIPAGELNAAM